MNVKSEENDKDKENKDKAKDKNAKNKKNKDDKTKKDMPKALNYKVNVNPFLSFSGFIQPEPIKKNFDKFFNTYNNKKLKDCPKRQIAIFKTKAIENHIKNRYIVINLKRRYETFYVRI